MTTTKKKPETRSERNIRWIETYLYIPSGKFAGQPFKLAEFQKDIVKKIYDNPHGTRYAILSMGRKNAKTTITACLVLLHLIGPEAVMSGEIYTAAQDRSQSAILFELAHKMIQYSPYLSEHKDSILSVRDSAKNMVAHKTQTKFVALSRDAKTKLGTSPSMLIFDEIGQVKGPTDELFTNLDSGCAAREQPLTIFISTQAESDSAFLSRRIEAAKVGDDPQTVLILYEAPEDLAIDSEEAIRAANPAWDSGFMNREEVLRSAMNAKKMPAEEAKFRNLILNQRIDQNVSFVSKAQWKLCGDLIDELDGQEVYAGLDLSTTTDLTAFVMVYRTQGGEKVNVQPLFWIPNDDLATRSNHDGAPYVEWQKAGFIDAVDGKLIDYDIVAERVKMLVDAGVNFKKIGFDRYNMKFFRGALIRQGLTEKWIDDTFKDFGQGFVSMSPAIRFLEGHILTETLAHGNHPCLAYCMSNVAIDQDSARNRKFVKTKGRPNGRIDGAVALAMAIGVMQDDLYDEPATKSYLETSPLMIF